MTKEKKKTKEYLSESLRRDLIWGFVILTIVVFPFYFHNYYLDIGISKKTFFQNLAVIFIGGTVVLSVIAWFSGYRAKLKKYTGGDLCALAFGATVLISCALSPCGAEAFWGEEGRRLGGFYLILCIICYLIVSNLYQFNLLIKRLFFVAMVGLCMFVVLQFWGFDLFDMYANLHKEQHNIFMGTFGNININSGYFSVVTAIIMAFYYIADKKVERCCLWIMSVLGIYTCYSTRSDSCILVMVGILFLLLFLSTEEKDALLKWSKVFGAFLCGSVAMKMTIWANQSFNLEIMRAAHLGRRERLCAMLDTRVLIIEGMFLILFLLFVKSKYIVYFQKYGYIIVLGVIAAVGVSGLIYMYPLEDSFGTNRGYIWKRTVWNFMELPIIQKLFGYGPNCFLQSLEVRYGAEMREMYDAVYWDAHNEFLQYLAVTGIFGAASYMGIQISTWIACFRKRNQDKIMIIGCVGIAAYAIQGLVNNPSVITFPMICVFWGIMNKKIKDIS